MQILILIYPNRCLLSYYNAANNHNFPNHEENGGTEPTIILYYDVYYQSNTTLHSIMKFSVSVLVAAFLFSVAASASASASAAIVDDVTTRDETSGGPEASAAAAVVEVTTWDEASGSPAAGAAAAVIEVTTRDETSDGPGRPSRRTLVSKKIQPQPQ